MKKISLSEIKVPSYMAQTPPNPKKIATCKDYWLKHHEQDRYIVLNKDNEIVDGYVQYLVLKEIGLSSAYIANSQYVNAKNNRLSDSDKSKIYGHPEVERTYLYGIHPNTTNNKEYVWRVPEGWKDYDPKVGDLVYCKTKFGVSPVIVTKMKRTDKHPVECFIKRVATKRIIRREDIGKRDDENAGHNNVLE